MGYDSYGVMRVLPSKWKAVFEGLDERDRRISKTLEDLLEEVNKLILLAEDLEKDVNCNR